MRSNPSMDLNSHSTERHNLVIPDVQLFMDRRCSVAYESHHPLPQHFYFSNSNGQCRQAQVWSDNGQPVLSTELVVDTPIENHNRATVIKSIEQNIRLARMN